MRIRVACSTLVALLAACGAGETPPADVPPLLFIGVDGLDPGVTAELLEAGRLPHLARFADAGVLGRLTTQAPTYSPVIWTTIATGQPSARHGITDFLDEESGLPFTSNCRKVPALWNLVSDAGRTVDTVGWWVSWPAEPVNGRAVTSYAAQAQAKVIWKPNLWRDLEQQTWPPGLASVVESEIVFVGEHEELLEHLGQAFPLPAAEDLDEHTNRFVTDLAWTHAADLSFAAIAESFLASGSADLTLVYLALPDVAGHRFWRYYDPEAFDYEVPAADLARFGDYVASAYVEVDRLVGRILDAAPPGANVLLVSDHGMHEDRETLADPEAITSGHHPDAPPGVFGAMGPAVKRRGNQLDGARGDLGHVLGVAPLVMHLLELPVPEHWVAVRSRNNLERVLDDRWRVDHPLELGPDPDPAFRAATPPRLPALNTDLEFRESFAALGYLGEGASGRPRESDRDTEEQQ